jgi:hypothetical protein
MKFDVPAGEALTNSTTYYWRVRAKDPSGTNTWSNWSNISTIAFRSVGTVKKNTGSGNMASVALPSGHTTDDILLLHVFSADNVASSVTGWTNKLAVNTSTIGRYELWWKRDNGSESAPTVTHTAGNDALAYIEAYSGVSNALSDPFRDAQTSTGNGAASAGFNITIPALTGVISGDMLISAFGFGDANTSGTVSLTPPSGFTANLTAQNNNTGTQEAALRTAIETATGSAGATTAAANYSSGAAPAWVGAQMALIATNDRSFTVSVSSAAPVGRDISNLNNNFGANVTQGMFRAGFI